MTLPSLKTPKSLSVHQIGQTFGSDTLEKRRRNMCSAIPTICKYFFEVFHLYSVWVEILIVYLHSSMDWLKCDFTPDFPPAYCFISSRGKRRTYRIRSTFRESLRKQARASQQGHKSSLIQISPSKSNKTVCHAPSRSPVSPLYGSGRWHRQDGPKKSNIFNTEHKMTRYTYSRIKNWIYADLQSSLDMLN